MWLFFDWREEKDEEVDESKSIEINDIRELIQICAANAEVLNGFIDLLIFRKIAGVNHNEGRL